MTERSSFLPVAAAYDLWAGTYDTQDNPMVFGASRIVEGLAGEVRGRDVVEFGCGTGRNLARLRAGGAAGLTGLDLSAGMLEQARQRSPDVHLLRHDMSQPVALPDASADLALFCLSLEHMADLLPPLREARRLLRPRGEIRIVEIHPFLSLGGTSAHFQAGGREIHMPTVAHGFADYLNTFTALGLRPLACREWRPRDFGGALPERVLKRGPDHPLLVEFQLGH
ncbi:class I SAM-dependent methyltransferase [Roseomonas gilardii subsp. gilardii]|uniref:class I SAM-dependent methyltransferase n=1 Tax=Roseomonas gilardii TaxID=257708 RepID=UPI001FFA2C0D|nr:class I SAM-dependent methyltransferase [Roseomonas gilardii]UPG71695.1 class I SAM-dependent methyltransferase [Roseomonas gilardii subsp. gilardii]